MTKRTKKVTHNSFEPDFGEQQAVLLIGQACCAMIVVAALLWAGYEIGALAWIQTWRMFRG